MKGRALKPCSISKIEANRRNAQKSTGPRTPEGKATSRWNALTHGLLAKAVVITHGNARENRKEFGSLLSSLRQDLQPEGTLEEMLVERIASCYWRLRRVQQCEIGMIESRRDEVRLTEMAGRPSIDFDLDSSSGIYHRLVLLGVIKGRIKKPGYFCDREMDALARVFGRDHDLTRLCCLLFEEKAEGKEKESPDQEGSKAKCPEVSPEDLARFKTKIREKVDEEEEELRQLKELVAMKEDLRSQVMLAPLYLPDAEDANLILRYETAIEKQIYRAMDQLESLQRQRRGEFVPPPVRIRFSGNG